MARNNAPATKVKALKPWQKVTGKHPYRLASRTKGKLILIVCEGQTEELYFKSFPIVTATVRAVPLGMSKVQLVEQAQKLAKQDRYDEVWCVFDMDFKPGETGQFEEYDRAILLSERLRFKAAFSNDAFELWFALHYQFYEQQYHRTFYYEKLSGFWGINYEKDGKVKKHSKSWYQRLEDDDRASQSRAIEHAQRLCNLHCDKPYHKQNPVTTVHLLVTELNRHLRP